MDRAKVLDTAKEMVTGHREQDYGKPENNFEVIARFWEIYLEEKFGFRVALTSQDVANMMIQMKLARITTGTGTADSYVDLAGYAACACAMIPED